MTIELPFLDEFTSLSSEYTQIVAGDGVVSQASSYVAFSDPVGGSPSNARIELPWSAFADPTIFNKVIQVTARVGYVAGSANFYYAQLRLADTWVGSLVRYTAGPFIDATMRNRTVSLTGATFRNTTLTGLPFQMRAVWNGSSKHVLLASPNPVRILEPGRLALIYSDDDGSTFQPLSLQRPSYDLRPNDDHGQDYAIGIGGFNYSSLPTFEVRVGWLGIEELTVGSGLTSEADTSKKVWYIASHIAAGSVTKVSEDGGLNWSALTGSRSSIMTGYRNASWAGDMQGARVLTPFGTGNRDLYLQSRVGDLYIKTHGGGAANRETAVFAGDGRQNAESRDRVCLLAIASAGSDNLLRVEYNYRGFYGSWSTLPLTTSAMSVSGLWFFSTSLVYAAGNDGAGARVWKYNGSVWSVEQSIGGGSIFGTIHAFDEDALIVTEVATGNTLVEWNGSGWTTRTLPIGTDRAHDVWGTVEDDGQRWWYCCGTVAAGGRVWRKRPGDASWSTYGPVLAAKVFRHVHPPGDGSVLVSHGNELWRLASAGGSWVLEDTATGYIQIESLHGTEFGGTGTDTTPPVLQNTDPSSGETVSNPETFYLEVYDANGNLDAATVVLSVSVDGGPKTDVWSSEAEQNGAIVTDGAITDGKSYDVRLPSPLLAESSLRIHVLAYDTHSNLLDTSYPFYVTLPPGTLRTTGPDLWLTDGADNLIDDDGHLVRDSTGVASRAKRRLLIQRGRWVGDPMMGSRLHEIETMTNARQRVEATILEALEPMVFDGSISEIIVGEIEIDNVLGHLFVTVQIVIPGESGVTSLGEIPLGG